MAPIRDKQLETMENLPPAVDVTDFVDHIDYLVEKMGIEHVGISSDFDGGGGIEGWSDASETLNVTLELVRRGYSEEEIAMLWSGNLLRVLDEVENVAKTLQ
jgi:membrane dipeptidase